MWAVTAGRTDHAQGALHPAPLGFPVLTATWALSLLGLFLPPSFLMANAHPAVELLSSPGRWRGRQKISGGSMLKPNGSLSKKKVSF